MDLAGRLEQWRVLVLATACVLIVPLASLCGCDSQNNDNRGRTGAGKSDDPDMNATAYHKLALAHYEGGRYAEAITAFEKAVAIKPDADAYYYMGDCYDELKEFAKAITAFEKAVALKPNSAVAYCFIGSCYYELKKYAKAITAEESAVGIKT